MLELVAEEDRGAFAAFLARVIGGESGIHEFDVVGLRGGRHRLDIHATPLRDAEGKISAP